MFVSNLISTTMKEKNKELSVILEAIEVAQLYSQRIPKQKKGLLNYGKPPIKHLTGVPMEYFKELEQELLSKKIQSS